MSENPPTTDNTTADQASDTTATVAVTPPLSLENPPNVTSGHLKLAAVAWGICLAVILVVAVMRVVM